MQPIITNFSPAIALPGEPVTINGSNFSTPAVTSISFGGLPVASFSISSDTETDTFLGGTAGPTDVTIGPDPLMPGTLPPDTYYYVVTAISSTGAESIASAEVSYMVTGAPFSLVLNWDAITTATGGYRVYRGKGTSSKTQYYSVMINTFTDTTLDGATTKYQFDITTTSGGGFSDEVNATYDPSDADGSNVNEPTGTLFENCKAISCRTNGLFSSSTYVRINGLIVDTVISSSVNNWEGHGISLLGNSNFIVNGCDVHGSDNSTDGVIFKNGISAITKITYFTSMWVLTDFDGADPCNTQISNAHGIISNNNVSYCGMAGIAVNGCEFINCFDNTLTATNITGYTAGGAEIVIMNPQNTTRSVGIAGKGTVMVKGNFLTSPTARSILVVNVEYIYVEDNSIDGSNYANSAIRINADYGISGTYTIKGITVKGNTMQNSIAPASSIADISVVSIDPITYPASVDLACSMGNTADFNALELVDFSAAAASVLEYDNRYTRIGTVKVNNVNYSIPCDVTTVILGPVFTPLPKTLTLPDPTAFPGRMLFIHTKFTTPLGLQLTSPSQFITAGCVMPGSAITPDFTSANYFDENTTYILFSDGTYWWDLNSANIKSKTVRTGTSTYTITSNDRNLLLNTSTGSVTATLPDPGDASVHNVNGGGSNVFTIRHLNNGSNGNTLTLTTPAGTIIGHAVTGAASYVIPQFGDISLVSDGTNWYIINQYNNNTSFLTYNAPAGSFTINLTSGNLIVLSAPSGAGVSITFPNVTDGVVLTIWVKNIISAYVWNVSGTPNVTDAGGVTISTLAISTVYKFFGSASASAWILMS